MLGTALPAQTSQTSQPAQLASLEVSAPARTLTELERLLFPLPGALGERLGPSIGVGKLAAGAFLGTSFESVVTSLGSGPWTGALWARQGGFDGVLRLQIAASARTEVERLRALVEGRVATRAEDAGFLVGTSAAALGRSLPAPGDATHAFVVDVDLGQVRALRHASTDALWSTLDGGGRILLGSVVAALDRAAHARLAVSLTDARRLSGELRFEPAGAVTDHPSRAFLREAPAQVVPLPPEGLLRLVLARSFTELFAHPEALLRAEDAAKLASAHSILDALAGGKSFAKDLVPELGALALYVLPPSARTESRPRLVVPDLVITAEVRSPLGTKVLERIFDAFATLQAFERAQQGKPVFERRTEDVLGMRVRSLVIEDHHGPGAPPVEVALSPTLLFAHGHAIVGSTREGALAIAARLGASARESVLGDELLVHGQPLGAWLRANRSILTLDRLLDEGEPLADARWFAEAVADAATLFTTLRVRWHAATLEFAMERRQR